MNKDRKEVWKKEDRCNFKEDSEEISKFCVFESEKKDYITNFVGTDSGTDRMMLRGTKK